MLFEIFMIKSSKIYVAGHRGLAGSAITRALLKAGYSNLITRTSTELDLRDAQAVKNFFAEQKPEYVFMAAAKVGGILANKNYPADFIYENLAIQNNIFFESYKTNVKKLLFLGSSCIYPRACPQPIKEEYFLTGELEETNKAYAVAKIAGVVTAQSYSRQYGCNFISVMPTNLYGPNDNFDPETSHALPGLIGKFGRAAKTNSPVVTLWGDGSARREFLFVDDLAEACLFLMQTYNQPDIINIGTGQDLTVAELAEHIKKISGFSGKIEWDKSKPNGTPQKLLDIAKITKLGWQAKTDLSQGLAKTFEWFINNYQHNEI